MKNAMKYIFISFAMMCSTLYAQTFNRLPNNFAEKYSSLEEYEKEQADKKLKESEALIAAAIEEGQLNRLKDAFHDNDCTSFFNNKIAAAERTKKAGYCDFYRKIHLALFSSKPYDEGYILIYECSFDKETDEVLEDGIYVYRLDVKRKKCELLKYCHEDDEYLNDLLENKEMIEIGY